MNKHISRRQFILRSIEGAVATSFLAPSVFAAPGIGLRLGIVGLGERGGQVLDACIHSSVNVAALCDVDPLALRRGHAGAPEATMYPDIEQLAAFADVDAVAVAAPRAPTLAEAALRRGKHVFLASAARPDLQTVDRLARQAREQSLEIGLAPYDASWDIDALNRLLSLPLNPEATRARLTVLASSADHANRSQVFGLDLLHHAVNFAGSRAPSKVRAVSSHGPMGACWSASFLLDRESSVAIHAQAAPGLKPGDMSIVMETTGRRTTTRVVVDSKLEFVSSRATAKSHVPGLARFLAAASANDSARSGTESSLRVLLWSALLKNALGA